MDYQEALEYINGVSWLGTKPGLTRVTALLEKLGRPQDDLKFIHIAGTNGKGSCAAMLSSVMKCCGYRTGLFTSPYLARFNERMQVNGKPIGDEALAEVVTQVKPAADAMEDHPTEFEMMTAAAFLWFKQEKCDIVVLETGLGGRLDATNVIAAPEAAVRISPAMYSRLFCTVATVFMTEVLSTAASACPSATMSPFWTR